MQPPWESAGGCAHGARKQLPWQYVSKSRGKLGPRTPKIARNVHSCLDLEIHFSDASLTAIEAAMRAVYRSFGPSNCVTQTSTAMSAIPFYAQTLEFLSITCWDSGESMPVVLKSHPAFVMAMCTLGSCDQALAKWCFHLLRNQTLCRQTT